MLKVRVIPTLLWKEVGLVKGVAFDSWRRVGTVLPAILVYNTRDVDELILVDVNASKEGRSPDFDAIRSFASECFVPFTVGGGVRTVEDVRQLLRSGADKVSICSSLFKAPELIEAAAQQFGSQCIVASIDAKRIGENRYECYSHSGTISTGMEVESWAQEVERRGAGEILLTSIELDGTMAGYDLALITRVASMVSIPIIASGGAGNYEDMHRALDAGATAIAAASIFHFTEQTPLEAKQYLAERGVPVRNSRQ